MKKAAKRGCLVYLALLRDNVGYALLIGADNLDSSKIFNHAIA